MENKAHKEFLEKLLDLFDSAPKELSFSGYVHDFEKINLPERLKNHRIERSNLGLASSLTYVRRDDPDECGFDITVFLAKERE